MALLFALAPAVSSCGLKSGNPDISKPLSAAGIRNSQDSSQVRAVVADFAEQNQFAARTLIDHEQGSVDFSMRLYRDDISILVTRLRNGPIQVATYPLCACETSKRVGLQSAAHEATSALAKRLSQT